MSQEIRKLATVQQMEKETGIPRSWWYERTRRDDLPGLRRLDTFARSGEPTRLYERFYARRDARQRVPDNPLLYVPSHPARDLGIDLNAANIPKRTPEGKLDFHACRVAYISLVIESGATVKEAQALARHAAAHVQCLRSDS